MYAGPTIMLLRQYWLHDVQPVAASPHAATNRQTACFWSALLAAGRVTGGLPEQGCRGQSGGRSAGCAAWRG